MNGAKANVEAKMHALQRQNDDLKKEVRVRFHAICQWPVTYCYGVISHRSERFTV